MINGKKARVKRNSYSGRVDNEPRRLAFENYTSTTREVEEALGAEPPAATADHPTAGTEAGPPRTIDKNEPAEEQQPTVEVEACPLRQALTKGQQKRRRVPLPRLQILARSLAQSWGRWATKQCPHKINMNIKNLQ